MRITQTMIQRSALASLQNNLGGLAAAQQRVSTGLRIQKPSDDPVAAIQSMQAGGSLRALEQFRRNIGAATGRADAEEAALGGLTEILTRARELGVAQAGGTANAATRAIAKAEVDQLLQQVAAIGNTRFAGSFLFGGAQGTEPPVVQTGSPPAYAVRPEIDPSQEHRTEIGAGQFVKPNHNAAEIFASGVSALDALATLSTALGSDDAGAVRAALGGMDAVFDHVQGLIGDIGARANNLRLSASNLDALELNLRTFKSDLEEVDLERAITDMVSRQTAMQAAMMATSRIMGMTLTEYLR